MRYSILEDGSGARPSMLQNPMICSFCLGVAVFLDSVSIVDAEVCAAVDDSSDVVDCRIDEDDGAVDVGDDRDDISSSGLGNHFCTAQATNNPRSFSSMASNIIFKWLHL